MILEYNFHSTAENLYILVLSRFELALLWSAWGDNPRVVETLHYHFRYADLIIYSRVLGLIYSDKYKVSLFISRVT